MYVTTKALVLREVKYKDADKILTVLTPGEGKLTVRARGALRKGCKYGAAAQQLCYSEMTLFGNAGRWSLNEAGTLEQFLPLRADLGLLALGSYFAELLETVSDMDEPDPALLQLGLNSLYALGTGKWTPEHVKAVFELRLLSLAGFRPRLETCPVCGKEPEEALFSLNGGVLHCRGCPPGTAGVSLPLGRETLAALRYLLGAEPKRIFSFRVSPETERELGALAEAYLRAQLERGFGSLDYWKLVARTGKAKQETKGT
ncbi:MAG: DNA repair protein RecO [Oscillospiraceae bacterium]|nr:DNA repair protein RecO [Oscillospiraceae bacterium]MBQ2633495.1 DNA repair protein RecO [Oscillospiraceae bacterium]MBR3084367.1 DNA repair protein RecO [Oscillospiraceae bacterium]MBR6096998.1 DNA repair protein RecO [Oscillospiraceae bacterium]